jgi:hypothetical protein
VNSDFICLLSAALVYCGAFFLAMRHVERSIPAAEREAENKGYFRKRSVPPPAPPKREEPGYHYDSVSVMPAPPSDPPSSSGSDPPPSA